MQNTHLFQSWFEEINHKNIMRQSKDFEHYLINLIRITIRWTTGIIAMLEKKSLPFLEIQAEIIVD